MRNACTHFFEGNPFGSHQLCGSYLVVCAGVAPEQVGVLHLLLRWLPVQQRVGGRVQAEAEAGGVRVGQRRRGAPLARMARPAHHHVVQEARTQPAQAQRVDPGRHPARILIPGGSTGQSD